LKFEADPLDDQGIDLAKILVSQIPAPGLSDIPYEKPEELQPSINPFDFLEKLPT